MPRRPPSSYEDRLTTRAFEKRSWGVTRRQLDMLQQEARRLQIDVSELVRRLIDGYFHSTDLREHVRRLTALEERVTRMEAVETETRVEVMDTKIDVGLASKLLKDLHGGSDEGSGTPQG